ncbi:hypothetical protein [Mucilaginibacter aquatilis]|uniref:Uncharacterized protein n=1 Tax=Mucilaginibacter aquatilis TaxID=1517760 RepID=A0A6I4I4U5_9SPHI|nr:hypothetical protein [Mucilaginibacter aquatilis]MVN89797.1 hypothetical protein [Mucilaginibacter aquatilis]
MNKILSVLIIFLFFTAVSCQKSELKDVVNVDNFKELKQASIAGVNGPTTATINQELTFKVSWPYSGNCEKFSSFKTDKLSDTMRIQLYTTTNPMEDCNGKEVEHSKEFKFTPVKSGTYFLKFTGPNGAKAIIDTLRVE